MNTYFDEHIEQASQPFMFSGEELSYIEEDLCLLVIREPLALDLRSELRGLEGTLF